MASNDISQQLQNLKLKDSQDINILLLGETGVGKSTFINSIANYFHFKSFKKASKAEELLILIPSVITVTNEHFQQVTISIGSADKNEFQEIGAAGTQDVKTYVFPIGEGKTRLRLIDSPGMGDPRGVNQDDINCENILAYLSQLSELHAICFLMKPTTTRKTVFFEYCVKQILSRLEKSASKNIIFIFTNTRGSNYSPGDTLPCLQTIIDDIKSKPPHVNIPLANNIFSVDNESFRMLVAMKKGITFTEDIKQRFIESWNNSSKECWRLISYIVGDASTDGLKPHQLTNTMSINEARKIIIQLSRPLADITQVIHDNIRILDRHKRNLEMENQSLDELKKKLYIPVMALEVTTLTQPVTVCTSPKCAQVVKVDQVQKWHYRQRCHDPCYLTNVTKEIVGDLNLMHCAAISGRTCMKCTCDFSMHMHVYYLTTTKSDKIEDQIVKNSINQKEEAFRESQRLIQQIAQRKLELEQERDTIIESTAQFAHFLQHNAISPFSDSYKAYIEYLIQRENSLGRNGDPEVIHNLEDLLRQYEEMKFVLETSLQQESGTVSSSVTAQTVITTIHSLYKLKHTGKKIHELLKKQRASRNSEYDKTCEYVHPKASDLSQSESKKDKPKKEKKKESGTDEKKKDKTKDKKKDGKSTDDEKLGPHARRHPQPYDKKRGPSPTRNPQPHDRFKPHYDHRPPPLMSVRQQWQEPPPPYDGLRRDHHTTRHSSLQQGEPNVVVQVQVSNPEDNQKNSRSSTYPNYNSHDPAQRYQNAPYGPGPNYGPGYQGPNSQYYPPPPNPGHYWPPSAPYHGPPGPYHAPPAGPYPGPPSGYYNAPQEDYHGPPGRPYGSHYKRPQERQYNQQNSGPGTFQKHGQGYTRGQGNFKRGGARGRSKPRNPKDKKSGNEKSSRSSDSDSSSD